MHITNRAGTSSIIGVAATFECVGNPFHSLGLGDNRELRKFRFSSDIIFVGSYSDLRKSPSSPGGRVNTHTHTRTQALDFTDEGRRGKPRSGSPSPRPALILPCM